MAPRVTITGLAERVDDPVLKQHFVTIHPYAALYAGFGDFAVWRIRPLGGLFIGGFARAVRLRAADLQPDAIAVAAIELAAVSILNHTNTDHPDALQLIAGSAGNWQMVAVDCDGCDLLLGESVLRIPWSNPVTSVGDVRRELVALARAGRAIP